MIWLLCTWVSITLFIGFAFVCCIVSLNKVVSILCSMSRAHLDDWQNCFHTNTFYFVALSDRYMGNTCEFHCSAHSPFSRIYPRRFYLYATFSHGKNCNYSQFPPGYRDQALPGSLCTLLAAVYSWGLLRDSFYYRLYDVFVAGNRLKVVRAIEATLRALVVRIHWAVKLVIGFDCPGFGKLILRRYHSLQ
jgi:hypothetical protein